MKFENFDKVKVSIGTSDHEGEIRGHSVTHRNGKPDEADYQVYIAALNTTQEFKEIQITLVEKFVPKVVVPETPAVPTA